MGQKGYDQEGASASLPGEEPAAFCGLCVHPSWGRGHMEAAACLGERYPLVFPLAARPKGLGREEEGGYRAE